MDKVRVIKLSLRCFTMGWLGLLPLIGMVPALMAIFLYLKVKTASDDEWNPAGKHLLWGYILGYIGMAMSVALTTIITILVFSALF